LIVRTAGEKRISNFLLWQCAYAEFWYTDALWPDFTVKMLHEAIKDYGARKRKFGGIAARSAASLDKLNQIKNNPPGKPAQILCTKKQAFELAQSSKSFDNAAALWPGALTLIAKSSAAGAALSGATVGLRVPASDFILKLLEMLSAPLFASSANMHDAPPCQTPQQVQEAFEGRVEIIVLGGIIESAASAVVDLTGAAPIVVRPGNLGKKVLESII